MTKTLDCLKDFRSMCDQFVPIIFDDVVPSDVHNQGHISPDLVKAYVDASTRGSARNRHGDASFAANQSRLYTTNEPIERWLPPGCFCASLAGIEAKMRIDPEMLDRTLRNTLAILRRVWWFTVQGALQEDVVHEVRAADLTALRARGKANADRWAEMHRAF